MRSSPVSKWLLSAAALLVLAAPAQARQTRIVGGTSGERVAYQAGIVPAADEGVDQVYCGAVVRDATHVVTAAHCVDFPSGDAPAEIDVIADVVDVVTPEPTLQRRPVAIISTHPDYDPETGAFDAALITLAEPLELEAASPSLVDPLALALATPDDGTSAVVSGWGAVNAEGDEFQADLKWVEVKVLKDADCALHEGYDAGTMLCAGDPPGEDDACSGDSGGPLATGDTVPGTELIGIVSAGGSEVQPCSSPTHPGLYTRVAAPGIRSFLESTPVARPANVTPPSITGTPEVGQPLTCELGTWEGEEPLTFARAWRGTATASTAAQYTVTEADAGRTLSCLVSASNPGGTTQSVSAPVSVPVPPPPPPPPAPPAPPPLPPPPPPPPPAVDTTRPLSVFSSRRCAARRCRLVLLVNDVGGLAGATVRVTRRRLGGPRSRTVGAVRLGAGRYVVRTGRLRPGRHQFSAVATDAAGNRQARATRVTLRVRRGLRR